VTADSQNWYYRDFARTAPVQGPFTLAELAERAQTGELAYDSLVRVGEGEWLQADRVTELIHALRQRRMPQHEASAISAGIALDRTHRRQLNWFRLLVIAIFLAAIGGALIAVGVSPWGITPLGLLGQLITAVASVIFLCAIIRWAIEPLFAQLVDTNDHLSQIARRLKKDDRE
jgi:hypothetical protein